MADAVWPVGLPEGPLVDRLSELPADNLVRTPVDHGPGKLRRRGTAGVRKFAGVRLVLTRTQVATFDDFFTDTLESGALSFEFKHPRTAATVECRFTNTPTYTPLAPRQNGTVDRWTVDFDLEVLPEAAAPPPAPPGPMDVPPFLLGDAFDAGSGDAEAEVPDPQYQFTLGDDTPAQELLLFLLGQIEEAAGIGEGEADEFESSTSGGGRQVTVGGGIGPGGGPQ